MCGCTNKIGRMAKKSVSITTEDVTWAVGGALVSLGANRLINQAIAKMPEGNQATVAKAVPVAKVLGGGYLAIKKKTPRNWRFFGLGVAGTGAVEAGLQLAPEYFMTGTADGSNVFDLIGNSDVVNIPVVPSASLEPQKGELFEEEMIMGAYDASGMVL